MLRPVKLQHSSQTATNTIKSTLETLRLVPQSVFYFYFSHSFSLSVKNTVLGQRVILLVSPWAGMALCTVRLYSALLFKQEGAIVLFQPHVGWCVQEKHYFIPRVYQCFFLRGLQQGPFFCFRRLSYSPASMPIIFNQPLLRKWQQEKLEFSAWLPLSPVPLLLTAVCLRLSSLSPTVRCLIVQPVAHIMPAT